MVQMFQWLHEKVENICGLVFERYGRFIARHPWTIIFTVILIDVGLGVGVLKLKQESGIEQYTPKDSTASLNRKEIQNVFKINTSSNFYLQSLPDLGHFGTVIIEKQDGGNILNVSHWSELVYLYSYINSTLAYDDNENEVTYQDVCSKRFSNCVVEGDFIFSSHFVADLNAGRISFPQYTILGNSIYINSIIGGVKLNGDYIKTAKAIKLRFNLASGSSYATRQWELAFLEKMASFESDTFNIKYSYSDSLTTELNKTIFGDLSLIAVTFLSIILFSSFVLVGGNCVVNRGLLGFAGIVSTLLAIVAAVGFLGFCGVKFVDIVGGMPFLVLGIGVDDMFVLLSGLASTSTNDDIETRIGNTMKHSGISITITSVTDIVAFCVGSTSIFPSVQYFSYFTGCAILFCYLNYITFYVACMTVNEIRVSRSKHCCTCTLTQSSAQMEKDGKTECYIFFCSGERKLKRGEIEGPIEKNSKKFLKKIVLNLPAQVLICVIFIIYLGFSIWGVLQFKEDLDFRDLVQSNSYYHDFYDTDQRYFSQSILVSLNIGPGVDYRLESSVKTIDSLIADIKSDPDIENTFMLSWIHAYRRSKYFNSTSDAQFLAGLNSFLLTKEGNLYVNDIVIDQTLLSISASRLHVLSKSLTTSNKQAGFMVRIRDILLGYDLPVFAYSPSFILIENYAHVYYQTFQTLGICVAVIFVVTFLFIPLPIILVLVTINVVFIMVGVIGFMYYWGLTLSSITMIYIIMCVGFCIDFSTHVCHAFVQSQGTDRKTRTAHSIDVAGGAVFNGAMSTIIGISTLSLSSSQIFISFFKVMFLVMIFGLIHALILLPIMLAWVGPQYSRPVQNVTEEEAELSIVWEKQSKSVIANTCSNCEDEICEHRV